MSLHKMAASATSTGRPHLVPLPGYEIRVSFYDRWRQILNTDAAVYGGAGAGTGDRTRSPPRRMAVVNRFSRIFRLWRQWCLSASTTGTTSS